MLTPTDAQHLQHQIKAQLELAQLATIEQIRAMHRDLERLYRSQLVALLCAEELAASAGSPPPALVAAPPKPLWGAACISNSARPMVRATTSR